MVQNCTAPFFLSHSPRDYASSLLHYLYVLVTGFLERGCGREADKARGVAECLIRLRDQIRVQEIP